MTKQYKVFSCESQKVERSVEIDGAPVLVEVPAVVVQLTPVVEDGSGTIKLVVSAADAETLLTDTEVTLTIS